MPDSRLQLLRDDLPYYSENVLKIRTKAETIVPLVFNPAQLQLHKFIEEQKRTTGLVRILVLKGRQFGISTYVAARYYHRTALNHNVNTFILSHEAPSTAALFSIVDRFQTHNPLSPTVGHDNKTELTFPALDSSYVVATAGGKPSGRSRTLSLFHGSEVALWPNATEHFSASVQAIPNLVGTEIILETTSAGPVGAFYEHWLDARAGKGDYRAIFLPWSLDPDCYRLPPPDFKLAVDQVGDDEMSEAEYAAFYDLSLGQMYWRRSKIHELRNLSAFKREYPMTEEEAWTHSDKYAPFISPLLVVHARKRQVEAGGPLVLGVDPAGSGGDRFAIAARRGNVVQWVKYRKKLNSLEGTAWIRQIIEDEQPVRVNIDQGDIGAAIVTNLKSISTQYVELVRGINFGGTSQHRFARPMVPGPYNRRAEMWGRLRDWLELEEGVQLPDDPALQSDICAPMQQPRVDGNWVLESKEDMKSRGVRSPDLADAVVLTFASLEFFKDWKTTIAKPTFGSIDSSRPVQDTGAELNGLQTGWMA